MALPNLTPEQRKLALEKAAEARTARAALISEIRVGRKSMASIVEDMEESNVVAKTRVFQLLKAFPGWGPARVSTLMSEVGIPENRRMSGLGAKQRDALIAALDKRAKPQEA